MKKLLLLLLALSTLASCKLGRFVYYNFADITDHKVFPSLIIENDKRPSG